MRKYIIEVSSEGIKKIFIDGDKKYTERLVREVNNNRVLETGITSQLKKCDNFEEELLKLLGKDDIYGLWDYFEKNKDIEETSKRGKLIKHLAICDKCKTELISKYEGGIWGFSRFFRDENNNFYTKCPICDNEKKYPIKLEDIKEIYQPKIKMI